uniref:Uncharacterized protein n=1 Tax=Ciona savignyi TaxID=51511 RepID=H2ZCM1_CIOSA
MMLVGQTPGACVAACKTTYEIGVFKSNVSTCLGLETTVARVASEQCDTDLPCWIDRFGYRALNCFRRYQATGQSFTIEYPETEEEMILPHEEVENTIAPSRAPPMIEREEESASTPEIEPEAPQETPQPPQGEGELIRTNLSVEISSSGITENRSSLDDVPSEEDTRIPEERIEEENS